MKGISLIYIACMAAIIAIGILLAVATTNTAEANTGDCDQFAALSAQVMAQKLNGHKIPSAESFMENEMRANTSAWALQKRIRPAEKIINDFADVWRHACLAGWYPSGETK